MKVEREVIIDLLPAYFSGEASAATRALVEDYFREYPDFEKTARGANSPLEQLKVPISALDAEREKYAFERARQVRETSAAYLWMAILFTLLLFAFRIHDHKIVWILWEKSFHTGIMLATVSVFLWLLFFSSRGLKEPMRAHTKFLWMAILYTLLLAVFSVRDHRLVWFFFGPDPIAGILVASMTVGMWVAFFLLRRKAKREG
ncbi:MAG TPA: hypothetical protein VKW06_03180 [Candidatus Angelobacter sp.]|nr:hypothetical protein [Candidatus Angelobacter sp.]